MLYTALKWPDRLSTDPWDRFFVCLERQSICIICQKEKELNGTSRSEIYCH